MEIPRSRVCATLLALLFWIPLGAGAGGNVYMKMSDVEGPRDQGSGQYAGFFKCLSLSYSVSVDVDFFMTDGIGLPEFTEIRCVKPIGKASTTLAMRGATRTVNSSVTFYITYLDMRGDEATLLEINLTNAYITGIGAGISAETNQPVETLTFNFEKILVANRLVAASGQTTGWDIINNQTYP